MGAPNPPPTHAPPRRRLCARRGALHQHSRPEARSKFPYRCRAHNAPFPCPTTPLTGGRRARRPTAVPTHPSPPPCAPPAQSPAPPNKPQSAAHVLTRLRWRKLTVPHPTWQRSSSRVERFPTHPRRPHVPQQPQHHPHTLPHHPRMPLLRAAAPAPPPPPHRHGVAGAHHDTSILVRCNDERLLTSC